MKSKEMLLKELEETPVIQVTAFEDGKAIGSWDFHGESITIGRSRSADLRLPTETISRFHAILERTPEFRLRIKDTNSRNGIYLNDRRVEAGVLTHGDTVRIGAFTLRCELRRFGETSPLSLHEATTHITRRDSSRRESSEDRPSKPTRTAPVARRRNVRSAAEAAPTEPPKKQARPVAPAQPAPWMDPEDEEDLDLDIRPGFSLVDSVRSARVGKVDPAQAVLEVICYRDEEILQVSQVRPGESYQLSRGTLAKFDQQGSATVYLPPGSSGSVWGDGGSLPLFGEAGGKRCPLAPGDVIEMTLDGLSYIFRLVPAPIVGEDIDLGEAMPKAGYLLGMGGISIGMHLLILFIGIPLLMFVASLFDGMRSHDEGLDLDRFAEVQLETPPEPEKKVEKKKEPPKKQQPRRKERTKVARATKQPPRQTQGGSPKPTAKVASAGIAGAMGKIDVGFNKSSPLLASATNLKGMRVPGGGGYKVSAVAVKGKGVINGRRGGAFGSQDVGTINGQILNARGGAGGISKRGSGKVRGQVAAPPTRAVAVEGHLDRAQIARVVNKHIHEVRHCYEKNLLRDPSLAGKIVMEWRIDSRGRVVIAKTRYSSMRGGAVPGCIASRVRTWQFPKPRGGGDVVVTYPFLFESVGF